MPAKKKQPKKDAKPSPKKKAAAKSTAKKKVPAKKKPAAKKKKTAKKKPVKKEIAASIKQAVEDIPVAVADRVQPPTPPPPIFEEEDTDDGYRKTFPSDAARRLDRNKRMLLWFGVICLTSLVLVMWVWNMRVTFYTINASQEQTPSLVDEARNDFEEALRQVDRQENDFDEVFEPHQEDIEEVNAAVKKALDNVFSKKNPTTTP